MITRSDRFRGCLLGGAVGDALGAPVEFAGLTTILDEHGPDGITDYSPAFGRLGAITDDTQLTLFTAEGLLLARGRSDADPVTEINRAYLRWLVTQGESSAAATEPGPTGPGWLLDEVFLHHRRAPGNTCLGALRAGGMGTVDRPINHSKGCGGVMRVAPIGLVDDDPFRLAADAAALTHGHPSGFLAAGALAVIIAELAAGLDLKDAVDLAGARTAAESASGEVVDAIDEAVTLAMGGSGKIGSVEALGRGWVAEEALAMSIYCALVATDFADGLVLAVNHGGDSDSTGAMTGNILGTLLGEWAIPAAWLDALEGRETIARTADQLAVELNG